jgi:hypothetical protein
MKTIKYRQLPVGVLKKVYADYQNRGLRPRKLTKEEIQIRECKPTRRIISVRTKTPLTAPHRFHVWFPHHVFVFFNSSKQLFLGFSEGKITKDSKIFFPFVPNVYYDRRLCLGNYLLFDNAADAAMDRFWKSTFTEGTDPERPGTISLKAMNGATKVFNTLDAYDYWQTLDYDGVHKMMRDFRTRIESLTVEERRHDLACKYNIVPITYTAFMERCFQSSFSMTPH